MLLLELLKKLTKKTKKEVILEAFSDEEVASFIEKLAVVKGDQVYHKGNIIGERMLKIFAIKFPNKTLNVEGNVDIFGIGLTSLPIKFGKVTGNFKCFNNKLSSTENFPNYIGGNLWIGDNKVRFSEKEIRKVCEVKGDVWVKNL